ncbi:MAG: hypothetical protein KAU20_05345 [Nanoarchaeota archaeon]|nr:hypothetical protein [Nanoarchaeota archaeon]
MTSEQTNKADDAGDKDNPDAKKTEEVTAGVSIMDEARAIRDEIVKAKEELKMQNDRKEKLQANELLSSNAGGRQELPQPTKEDKQKAGAQEFFKGTQLEKDIEKL